MPMNVKSIEKTKLSLPAVILWPLFVLVASGFIGVVFSPYKGIATVSYLCLLVGIFHRRNRNVHAGLMSAGMAIDVLLVLVLEFQRSAIATSAGGSLNAYQLAHVIVSTLAVLVYLPTANLGYRRWKGTLPRENNILHLRFGILAFSLRTLGYILMFSMSNSIG
jgi:hypothetical protein